MKKNGLSIWLAVAILAFMLGSVSSAALAIVVERGAASDPTSNGWPKPVSEQVPNSPPPLSTKGTGETIPSGQHSAASSVPLPIQAASQVIVRINRSQLPVGSATCRFDEYPTGTTITNQYPGISFSGPVYLTTDGANPTSPVLSGIPTFQGPISFSFERDQRAIGFDAGYFNEIGGTRIRLLDRYGNTIGDFANTTYGIEFLGFATADGVARIKSVQISIQGTEPGGYAIDNLAYDASGFSTAAFWWSPGQPKQNSPTKFYASGAASSYSWKFGDGGTASGRNVSHTFTKPGPCSATLTAGGVSSTRTITIGQADGSAPGSAKRHVFFVTGITDDYAGSEVWQGLISQLLPSSNYSWDCFDSSTLLSLKANADRLAERVRSSNPDGQSSIILVGHSRGGLIIRQFLRSYGDTLGKVDFVYMLGTPNCGTELADEITGLACGLLPPSVVQLIPPSVDLTQGWMVNSFNGATGGRDIYSDIHSTTTFNDRYHVIAGNIPTLVFAGRTWDTSLAFLGESSDGAVPVRSVLGEYYKQVNRWNPFNRQLVTQVPIVDGSTTHANHQGLRDDGYAKSIFSSLLNRYPARAAVQSSSSSISFSEQEPASQASALCSFKADMGAPASLHVPVDSVTSAVFSIQATAECAPSVTAPSGQVITPSNVGQFSGIFYEQTSDASDMGHLFTIAGPTPGDWIINCTPAQADASQSVQLSAIADTTLSVRASNDYLCPCMQQLKLQCAVMDGEAPVAADVEATVAADGQGTSAIPLYDDGSHGDDVAGDGIYVATMGDPSPGAIYSITYKATGTTSGGYAFQRIATSSAQISTGSATFTGLYTDQAVSTRGDAAAEVLRIATGVNFTETGKFTVSGTLNDAEGNLLCAAETTLDVASSGAQNVALDFDGGIIAATGKNGPYTLALVTIKQSLDTGELIADQRHNALTTAAYQTSVFADTIPPPSVNDLRIVSVEGDRINLQWTQPVDNSGSSSLAYDLAYSNGNITEANFGSCDKLSSVAEAGRSTTTFVDGLFPNSDWYFALKCTDPSGNVSSLSNVVAAAKPQNTSIDAAIRSTEGSECAFQGSVTAVFSDRFYVESLDRTCGIAVDFDNATCVAGDLISVSGKTSRLDGETAVTPDVDPLPIGAYATAPLCTQVRNIVAQGGLRTAGLLFKVAGKVIAKGNGYIVMNDGSVVDSDGLRIPLANDDQPPVESLVMFTGVAGRQTTDQGSKPVLRLCSAINVISPVEAVSVPGMPVGNSHPTAGVNVTYTTTGSSCNWGQAVEYSFNWGDGTSSDWSTATSASHYWSSLGAQVITVSARCKAHPAVSATSASLQVNVGSDVFIVESRAGGLNYGSYIDAGFDDSSGNVTAPGCTGNIGSRYSSTLVSFGPSKYAQFSFTPVETGCYYIDLAWCGTAAESATAINLYTGAATGSSIADRWGNVGGPQDVVFSGTMDMYSKNTGMWNRLTTARLTSGTTYKVGIYGGYKTPYSGGATSADTGANRVTAGAAMFTLSTAAPTAVSYVAPANGARNIPLLGIGNDLTWTAGQNNFTYDVYLDTNPNPVTRVASDQDARLASFDPDSLNLIAGTTYYWKVVAKNAGKTAEGPIWSFTPVSVIPYSIAGIPNPAVGGTCSGQPWYVPGWGSISWTATPNSGYYMHCWTSDLAGSSVITTANPYSFTPTGDSTFYAQFKPIPTVVHLSTTPAVVVNASDLIVTWDTVSGDRSLIQIDGGAWTDHATSPYTIPTSALAYGDHTIGVKCVDIRGYQSQTTTLTFRVDRSSIRTWSVLGHFAWDSGIASGSGRFAKDFLDAPGISESGVPVKTGLGYTTSVTPAPFGVWTTVASPVPIIDFNSSLVYNTPTVQTEYGASYLFTYVVNNGPAIADAYLTCGSDDGINVWLNGAIIGGTDTYRRFTADSDLYGPFTIKSGANPLLIKVTQGDGGYEAQARFCGSTRNEPSWLGQLTYVPSDDTGPTGSVIINDGAATATGYDVTLTLAATDQFTSVKTMSFSNDRNTWSSPEPFAATKQWALQPGSGTKTVYVRFGDVVGNVSGEFSDDIEVPLGWTLTPTACDAAAGVPNGGGVYSTDAAVTVHANANQGYTFSKWTSDACGGAEVVSTSPDFSFSMPGHDYRLWANYTALPHTLSLSACSGGSVTGDAGIRSTGQLCTVTATPDPTHRFVGWTTDGCGGVTIVSTNPAYTFNMPASDLNLSANFKAIPMLTTADSPTNGGISTGGGARHDSGAIVTVSAAPNPGYKFAGWSTDAGGIQPVSTDNPYTFAMPDADLTLYARYVGADLIFEDSFENGVGAWPISPTGSYIAGTASTTYANLGTHSLLYNNKQIKIYHDLGAATPPVGSKIGFRFWVRDPGPYLGYMADIRNADYPSSLFGAGSYSSNKSIWEGRLLGAGSGTNWSDLVGATRLTCPALPAAQLWNRFDICYDGANTVVWYVNGVRRRTATDVTQAQVNRIYIGYGTTSSSSVTAGYFDDVAFFTNPKLLTTGVQSGNGTVSGMQRGSTLLGAVTGYYYPLEIVTLVATPSAGATFAKWVGADGVTEVSRQNPYVLSMPSADTTVMAVFN